VSGRKGTAPCGHQGTYIIGQFVNCDVRCHENPPEPSEVKPGTRETYSNMFDRLAKLYGLHSRSVIP
jgi:hypothetical protein